MVLIFALAHNVLAIAFRWRNLLQIITTSQLFKYYFCPFQRATAPPLKAIDC